MVFIWGSKGRVQADAVTRDKTYRCPKCSYLGRLLLYRRQKQSTVYFVPVGGWRNDGGALVCPACGTVSQLSRRKYGAIDKIDSGPELVRARAEIEDGFLALVAQGTESEVPLSISPAKAENEAHDEQDEDEVQEEEGLDDEQGEPDQPSSDSFDMGSDTPDWPGSWLASDGMWYPPESDLRAAQGWVQGLEGEWLPPPGLEKTAPGWWMADDGGWYPPSRHPRPPVEKHDVLAEVSPLESVDETATLTCLACGLTVSNLRQRDLSLSVHDIRLSLPCAERVAVILTRPSSVLGFEPMEPQKIIEMARHLAEFADQLHEAVHGRSGDQPVPEEVIAKTEAAIVLGMSLITLDPEGYWTYWQGVLNEGGFLPAAVQEQLDNSRTFGPMPDVISQGQDSEETSERGGSVKCPKCGVQLPPEASFCMSCGQRVESPANTRTAAEVDTKWLIRCFQKEDYECPADNAEDQSFNAVHNERPIVLVELRQELGIVSMIAVFGFQDDVDPNDPAFLTAVNRFNDQSLLWIGSLPESGGFMASTFMTMMSSVSELSIANFLNVSSAVFRNLVVQSEIDSFLD